MKAAQEIEQDYLHEVEKVKKLTLELESLKKSQRKAVDVDRLTEFFKENLGQLHAEAERLRSNYPLYDLLSAKQAEVDRMKKMLSQVRPNHPDRPVIESTVKSHIAERDEIRRIVQDAETRFETYLNKVNRALDDFVKECQKVSAHSRKKKGNLDPIPAPEY